MKILVLCENYPDLNGGKSLMYVHTRNQYYLLNNIEVSVVCFRAEKQYIIEGIKVYTEEDYKKKLNKEKFDLVICHAPNLKNHYRFLNLYVKKEQKKIFILHGHEIVKINKAYPTPYTYLKKKFLKKIFRSVYDEFKLVIWKKYITRNIKNTHLVFVSRSLYKDFLKFSKIKESIIKNNISIINNSISERFELNTYSAEKEKKYDFITIRSNLDESAYCIDIINNIALLNPEFKFLIIGKGLFYKYNKQPENVNWINKQLTHEEIINMLDESKCGLMLTRRDTQGVMACEMATFGIPLITSNIEVCKEILSGFTNTLFIDNEKEDICLELLKKINNKATRKNNKYYAENTVRKEIELFDRLNKSQ